MAHENERQRRPWTVMVYMVADDPQGGALFDQVAHRELDRLVYGTGAADPNEQLYVAAQVDFRSQPFVWRRIIREGTWIQPESSASDPATLYGFFRWATRMCPAERYALIFWGHSSGPFGLFSDDDFTSYVAQTLTLNELRDALQAATREIGAPLDLVAFKDCCMSTLETVRELKDLATYVLGSQYLVPAEGWPYKDILTELLRGRDLSESVKGVANALAEYYTSKEHLVDRDDVPYSLLDTRKTDAVVGALSNLVHFAVSDTTRGQTGAVLRQAVKSAALHDEKAMIDLSTFCRSLQKYGDEPLRAMAAEIEEAAGQIVVSRSGQASLGGLNLFCYPIEPRDQLRSRMASNASASVYRSLRLSTETRWNQIALATKPPVPKFLQAQERRARAARSYGTNALLPQTAAQLQRQGAAERLQLDAITFLQQALGTFSRGFDLASLFTFLQNADLGKGADFDNKGADFDTKGADFDTKGADFETGFNFGLVADLDDDRVAAGSRRGKANGRTPAGG